MLSAIALRWQQRKNTQNGRSRNMSAFLSCSYRRVLVVSLLLPAARTIDYRIVCGVERSHAAAAIQEISLCRNQNDLPVVACRDTNTRHLSARLVSLVSTRWNLKFLGSMSTLPWQLSGSQSARIHAFTLKPFFIFGLRHSDLIKQDIMSFIRQIVFLIKH